MEILILSGKFGNGHWSAACSLRERLEREGHTAQVVDFFAYALPEWAPAIYRGFGLLVRYGGGLYNLYHRATRNGADEVPLAGVLTRRMAELLAAVRPDAVIATHPVCAGAAARYKRELGARLPLITCVTDVTCHSEWIHRGTDCYLAPSAAVGRGLAAKGVERARIAVTGIPVSGKFGAAGTAAGGEAPGGRRRELLIMGGGLGLMPRRDGFYQALDSLPGVHTTILTGRNDKLFRRLAGRYANIEAVPFTDRVDRYMARADLMLSKPGGIPVFEAIASRLPILAWEPFLEQERENARFLLDNGIGLVAAREESACLAAVRACIYHDALLSAMARRMDAMCADLQGNAIDRVVHQVILGEVCA